MQSFRDLHLFHSQRKTFYRLSERQVYNDHRHPQKHQLYLLGHGHQMIKKCTFFVFPNPYNRFLVWISASCYNIKGMCTVQ